MKRIHPLIPAVFALLVVVVPVGAAAQVAMMNFSSSAVTWSPMIANDGMTLTVSGGGVWFQKNFESGASPRFDTFDAEGNALADGVYKWELSARPARTAGDRGEWENARTNADGSFVRHGTAERIEPQSGTFRIANGSIVDPNGATEGGGAAGGGIGGIGGGGGKGVSGVGGPGTNDQQILDDLIVDGSICVGLDCVNGESFGFDTLRLAENNLRINFKDTSTSASFPSNDWELTANESQNGGQNKFSITDITGGRIPFTVEAGAPSHSLYLDDGGRLGLGTSTPVADVHVVSGNTPTLRLEQNGTSGFTPQTWDLAGNEANFFIRDSTNGSTLPFRIFPSAPSNALNIEASTGDVGIGTTSPTSDLHVKSDEGKVTIEDTTNASVNTNEVLLELNAVGDVSMNLVHGDSGNTWQHKNNGSDFQVSRVGSGAAEITVRNQGQNSAGAASSNTVQIEGGVAATAFNAFSSRELKTDFAPVDGREVLDKLMTLPITSWRFKNEPETERHIGPISEEFNEVLYGRQNAKLISATDINGVALAAIQGLYEVVEELKAENARLANEVEQLKAGQ